MEQKNIKILMELVKRPGNGNCADCGSKDVEYASYNIGVFLCSKCTLLHNQMGTNVSKAKHLKLDHWEDSQLDRLKQVGNLVAKARYEARVPLGFRRPSHTTGVLPPDPHILLDHWITSKYIHEEFATREPYSSSDSPSQPPPLRQYLLGIMDSYLMKKGREDPRYFPRRFVLDSTSLRYFVKEKSNPKAVIKLVDLDVILSPQKCSKPYSLQLSYLKDGSTRHIYVYHDDPELVLQWYQALRIAKLTAITRNCASNSSIYISESVLLSLLPGDALMEGYLWKAGPSPSYAHRRRYFVLCNRKLMYHVEPLDAYPKGEIFLGLGTSDPVDPRTLEQGVQSASKIYDIEIKSSSLSLNGYKVSVGGFGDDKMDPQRWVFSLHTPYRTFILAAETQAERDKWVSVIDYVLKSEITPRDIATCSVLVRKRNGSTLANISVSNPLSGLLSSSSSSTSPSSSLSSSVHLSSVR